ncbi:kynureninase [Nonomuraea sediminis]|uniref:kynureninase n=1 Tax=Nonomuraea sediminis TaxID=2835864 RepID=UPI001BDC6B51|nr:kynureninase [Nonomuraea sediminis]
MRTGTITRADCEALDRTDPLASMRKHFTLPADLVYLDGNSLGALPRAARAHVGRMIDDDWGQGLVRSWMTAGWYELPRTLGDRLAPLLGTGPGQVVVGDSTSVNVFKAVTAALRLRPDRDVVVSDHANFPSDLYAVESAASPHHAEVRPLIDPDRLDLDERVAAVVMGHVDYRTGAMRDMAAVTERVHRHGALMIWDVCHSAGAMPLHLASCDVDFAIGCTYKYLNGGPGAPAFLYAAPRFHQTAEPSPQGWFGHADPFAFDTRYTPAPSVSRFLVGTPPLLAYAALEGSLEVWERTDLGTVREKSVAQTSLFIDLVEERCGDRLELVTPRDPSVRGSQVSYRHPAAPALVEALGERGVIADARRPDILRFGFAPLYVTYADVWRAAETLATVAGRHDRA